MRSRQRVDEGEHDRVLQRVGREEMAAVKNAQIKQLAAERRKSLEASYDKVKMAYGSVEERWQSLPR